VIAGDVIPARDMSRGATGGFATRRDTEPP